MPRFFCSLLLFIPFLAQSNEIIIDEVGGRSHSIFSDSIHLMEKGVPPPSNKNSERLYYADKFMN